MPSKHVLRSFRENSYYHIFNRGVEKRPIFLDGDDYQLFQHYLFTYLRPIEEVLEKESDTPLRLIDKSLSGELELLAYCLMPNHFHLLLKQKSRDAVPRLLKQLTNAYTYYFNQKYQRVGALMQGRYKAAQVNDEKLLIHLMRFIHLNPLSERLPGSLDTYRWASYREYLGNEAELPVSKGKILNYFPSVGAFKGFHEDQKDYIRSLEKIGDLAID